MITRDFVWTLVSVVQSSNKHSPPSLSASELEDKIFKLHIHTMSTVCICWRCCYLTYANKTFKRKNISIPVDQTVTQAKPTISKKAIVRKSVSES